MQSRLGANGSPKSHMWVLPTQIPVLKPGRVGNQGYEEDGRSIPGTLAPQRDNGQIRARSFRLLGVLLCGGTRQGSKQATCKNPISGFLARTWERG